jgi:exosortase/archaeosortase family protein
MARKSSVSSLLPRRGKDPLPLGETTRPTRHATPFVILAMQGVAFWPVWQWYVARIMDGSDEPWGVVALGTALLFLLRHGKPARARSSALALASVFAFLYTLSFPVARPLVRAMLAVLALGATVSAFYLGRSVHLGILGLLLLSLPLIASLQFYLGYPVRVVTAEVAARLITLSGYPVTAEGNCLRWLGDLISVDAPCGGIKMLWAGLYLNFTLACLRGLGALRTWLTYSLSVLTIFTGNLLRTAALFYGEAHIIALPPWGHQGVGILAFLLVALAIVTIHKKVGKEQSCGSRPS